MPKSCQVLPTIWSIPDELWDEISPLLKVNIPKKKSGRPRSDDRRILNRLIYLARTGCQWRALPTQFGPKSTVYQRFREWLSQGCLEKVCLCLLKKYDGTIGISWEWCAADGCIVKAPLGKRGIDGVAEATGSNPTDRGKAGSKQHLCLDRGYDYTECRMLLEDFGYIAHIR